MDFLNVPSVNIKVRDLSLSLERSPPLLQRLRFRRPTPLGEEKWILQNVSLDVPAGSLMAIVGASGSGKVPYWESIANGDLVTEFDGSSNDQRRPNENGRKDPI